MHTNYYVVVEENSCIACGACVERCQMDAIRVDDTAIIDADRCIGCGLCVTHCPTDSIRLEQKAPEEHHKPPRNMIETYMKIAQERELM